MNYISMWHAASDRDYQEQGPRLERTRTGRIPVCRCGARMTHGSAIGHLSHESICLDCAKAEGAEYLRRLANRVEAK